jgi:hypothetical protein
MKKLLSNIVLLLISIYCYSQINFEKGYFINNENRKIDCYIKNSDWVINPTIFKYKLSENGVIENGNIKDVNEFCIINSSKYIRADVDIDTSPNVLKDLTRTKEPFWSHKQLFLKVLVEGKAKLYYYNEGSYERFFYACKDTIIKQLIYKEYVYDEYHTSFNNSFRQQLYRDVCCSPFTANSIQDLNFNLLELEKYFQNYNACIDSSFKVNEIKHDKGEFDLGISLGLNYSSLSISNDSKSYVNTDFGGKVTPTFSFGIEYIMPFNKHKWAIKIETNYQSYKSDKQSNFGFKTVDFKSVDLAFGFKHYLYLNDKNKFFIDCNLNSLVAYCSDSKIGYRTNTSNTNTYLDIKNYNMNFILGAGFEYNRIIAEIRYFTNQNILSHYPLWNSNLEKISLVIGYKFLKTK